MLSIGRSFLLIRTSKRGFKTYVVDMHNLVHKTTVSVCVFVCVCVFVRLCGSINMADQWVITFKKRSCCIVDEKAGGGLENYMG